MKWVTKSIFSATLCITGTMILCTILNRIELINLQQQFKSTIKFTEAIKNLGGNLFLNLFYLSLILIGFGIILFFDTFVSYFQSIEIKNIDKKNNAN